MFSLQMQTQLVVRRCKHFKNNIFIKMIQSSSTINKTFSQTQLTPNLCWLFKQADLRFININTGENLPEASVFDGPFPWQRLVRDQNIHFLGFQHQGRKEGRNGMFSFMLWWMWGWGGSVILECFLPSVSAANVTPTSPQLHISLNNPKIGRLSAAPCWESVQNKQV